MNFKQRFDDIIAYIENNVCDNKKDIMDGILKEHVITTPSTLNGVFEFMTGMRLSEYITRRKLIKILEVNEIN